MGGAGNISSDLYRAAVGGGVPTARISKEVTGYKPARPRFRMRTVETASRKKINPVPLAVTQFDSVWQALENTGVEAVNLELRSGLMLQIRRNSAASLSRGSTSFCAQRSASFPLMLG
jgi:hypothetical protein